MTGKEKAEGQKLCMIKFQNSMAVKLILRDKEYEVKPGMTLLDSLRKADIVPESVIATKNGEMIVEDEILKDGDVVRLIAVISGGSRRCEERSDEAIPNLRGDCHAACGSSQ